MKLGQTEELIKGAKNRFSEQIKIETGDNWIRILNGPYPLYTCYYPTQVEDEGELKTRMRVITVDKNSTPLLKLLESSEKEIRSTMGENKPKSQFTPKPTYLYLAFDRRDPEPIVKVVALKWTAFQGLETAQAEVSTQDEAKLRNGLIFMYDISIRKIVTDPNRPARTTKYSIHVDTEGNKFTGKIPVQALKFSTDQIQEMMDKSKLWDYAFTPKELNTIKECKIDLINETTPMTDEEIRAKFIEEPIFLGAKDPDNRYYFPQSDKFVKLITTNGLKLIETENQDAEVPATESTQEEQVEVVKQTQEEQVEVIKPAKDSSEKVDEIKTQAGTSIPNWEVKLD